MAEAHRQQGRPEVEGQRRLPPEQLQEAGEGGQVRQAAAEEVQVHQEEVAAVLHREEAVVDHHRVVAEVLHWVVAAVALRQGEEVVHHQGAVSGERSGRAAEAHPEEVAAVRQLEEEGEHHWLREAAVAAHRWPEEVVVHR